jgi:hypothetical protein
MRGPVSTNLHFVDCGFRGGNLHPTPWQTRFPRAPLTYTLAPHVRPLGGLQMVASSRHTELNGILARFPDGATIRITYEAAYCCPTCSVRRREPEG